MEFIWTQMYNMYLYLLKMKSMIDDLDMIIVTTFTNYEKVLLIIKNSQIIKKSFTKKL